MEVNKKRAFYSKNLKNNKVHYEINLVADQQEKDKVEPAERTGIWIKKLAPNKEPVLFSLILLQRLPACGVDAAVCDHQEEARGCRSPLSVAQAGAFRHVEEAVCVHQGQAADFRFHPSAARGVSFLRPFWVLLSNVMNGV